MQYLKEAYGPKIAFHREAKDKVKYHYRDQQAVVVLVTVTPEKGCSECPYLGADKRSCTLFRTQAGEPRVLRTPNGFPVQNEHCMASELHNEEKE